jgi:transposase
MRPSGSAEQLEAGRMFAMGKSRPKIAEVCGVSVAPVKTWKRAWPDKGEAGLVSKPHPGAPSRLI